MPTVCGNAPQTPGKTASHGVKRMSASRVLDPARTSGMLPSPPRLRRAEQGAASMV